MQSAISGAEKNKNGRRRPKRLRVRSLQKLKAGLQIIVIVDGSVVSRSAMSVLLAPRSCNCFGTRMETSCIVRLNPNAPSSRKKQQASRPPAV